MPDRDKFIVRRIRVSGHVQGVFYRVWTSRKAQELGLSGWVRNRLDGTVEAVLSGPSGSVKDMIAACYSGPQYASVERIESEPFAGAVPDGFEMRPTVS